MVRFVTNKAAQYLVVLLVATTLNFVIPLAMPGDPLKALVGESLFQMSAEQKARVRAENGLDLPLHRQYLHYLSRVARLDLGYSYRTRQSVASMVADRLPWTLFLTTTSVILSGLIGSALGVWSAWHRGQRSEVRLLVTLLSVQSLPAFWVAMVLIALFSVKLRLLPVYGAVSLTARYTGLPYVADVLRHWLLPATTLVLVTLPGWFLTMRYAMLNTLAAEYVRVARAKGLAERRIMFRHAMRNALLPVVTGFMLGLANSIGGATLVETVFSYPGIGRMLYEAVLLRDYPVIRSTFLVITVAVIVGNLLADLSYPLLDPRLRRPQP